MGVIIMAIVYDVMIEVLYDGTKNQKSSFVGAFALCINTEKYRTFLLLMSHFYYPSAVPGA